MEIPPFQNRPVGFRNLAALAQHDDNLSSFGALALDGRLYCFEVDLEPKTAGCRLDSTHPPT